jgi:hypothetical protein
MPLCLLKAESTPTSPLLPSPRSCGSHTQNDYFKLGEPIAAVDLASFLQHSDSHESAAAYPRELRPAFAPSRTASATQGRRPAQRARAGTASSMPGGRRSMPPNTSDKPAKKQSKWSQEEDQLIIELRGRGMKWEDISLQLPGRSSISCRLHYQNYLEKRSEWDEDRKNKLARLYERFKSEMWAKVAEELAVPWRAAEAMHWQLGETDMARRAGVTPFSLAAVNVDNSNSRKSPPRAHVSSQAQMMMGRDMMLSSPHPNYMTAQSGPSMPVGRGGTPRREPLPPPQPMPAVMTERPEAYYSPGPGLAPIQNQPHPRGGGMLPGVAELTTGISPYNTPPASHSSTATGPMVATGSGYPPNPYIPGEAARGKRRASFEPMQHDMGQKRRLDPRSYSPQQ